MALEVIIGDYDCDMPINRRPVAFHVGRIEKEEIMKLLVGSAAYANLRRSMCPSCHLGCPRMSLADTIKAEAGFPTGDKGDVE